MIAKLLGLGHGELGYNPAVRNAVADATVQEKMYLYISSKIAIKSFEMAACQRFLKNVYACCLCA
jgi:hypothetical protein